MGGNVACMGKMCIKFYESPSSGSRVGPCGRTDRHDNNISNIRCAQFCERAYKVISNTDVRCGLYSAGFEYGLMVEACERGNKQPSHTKMPGNF